MALDKEKLDSLRIDRDARVPARRGTVPLALVAIAVLAAVLGGLWWHRSPAPAPIEVAVAQPLSNEDRDAVLNASGYVVARRMATVSAKVTGKIAEVYIEEGMSVAAGQLLARLDDATAKGAYALADSQLTAAKDALAEIEVRLDEARRNFGRVRPLLAQHLVSQADFDTAEANVKAETAHLNEAKSEVAVAQRTRNLRRQDLEDLDIRAPFAGVVVSKDAQPGEMVSPLSAGGGFTRTGICTIVDMASREVEVDVNEAYINRVSPGQRTEAILDAYPNWVIPSSVINIVPTADRQRATVKVRIGFDQLDPRILPEMGIKVSFLAKGTAAPPATDSAKALIPADAVLKANGNVYVWLVKDNVLTRQAIKIGMERSGSVAVLAGVAPGEQVALGALEQFKEGQRVRIKQ